MLNKKQIGITFAAGLMGFAAAQAKAETVIKLGGFVDLDVHYTHLSEGAFAGNSLFRDFYIPGGTPVVAGGAPSSQTTDFTAESTRFYIDAKHSDDAGNKIGGRIEMDFLASAQGNQRVSNSYSPRLRHAYIDFNNFRIGQTWSAFQNTSSIPESASFLVGSDGMIFIRQPLIQYKTGNWQLSLENGDTTVTPLGGGRIEADTNYIPDVVIRYNFTGDFGNVSVAALGRQLRLEAGATDEQTIGYGVSIAGRLNVGEGDDVRFSLSGGKGLGRYIGLNAANGAAINPITGDLDAITSYGAMLAWRHPLSETMRVNVGASGLWVDNESYTPMTSTKSVQSAFAALLWDATRYVNVGLEYMLGLRETEAGDKGQINRLTFSTRLKF